MNNCELIDELKRLRKSSSESIDNEYSYDKFKRYMHIHRDVEKDLKNILRRANDSGRKTLLLLCGSAGDGKSHLLSYLNNEDKEQLLVGWHIHNDATESSGKCKTAIQTLNEILNDFSDENLDQPGDNWIVAINLGVLNNFIVEYGEKYSTIKQYVYNNNILSSDQRVNHNYSENSSIQHISFADYQLYTLSKDGARSEYIEALLSKIFNMDEDNPFYHAFKEGCLNCPIKNRCPVKDNYLFAQNNNVQQYISSSIVMAIIKEKDILTTREILNYFYDIIVPQSFSRSDISKHYANSEKEINYYFDGMLSNLMYEQRGLTILMDHIRLNDPLLIRNDQRDKQAIEFYVSSNYTEIISEGFNNTPYIQFLQNIKVDRNSPYKNKIYKNIIRIEAISKNDLPEINDIYSNFTKTLYFYNIGNNKKIGNLYQSVEKAIYQWCGKDTDGHLCIDTLDRNNLLFEEISFNEDVDCIPRKSHEQELKQFRPEMKIGFLDKDDNLIASLEIDYSIYQIIYKLNNGYVYTENDQNNHAELVSFIEKISNSGDADKKVFIMSQNGNQSVLEKTKFGYNYKVSK